jgi:glycosyltransferase involved in cell wall biosynthesis
MRLLFFGTYDAAAHPRVAVLRDGLRERGATVRECNAPLGLSTADRVGMLRNPLGLPRLGWRIARCWFDLWRRSRPFRRGGGLGDPAPDAVVVGYLGHFDVLLARRLFPHVPVVLDHLVGASDTARDRGVGSGPRQRLLRALDAAALGAADVVVVDTEEHRAALPASARGRAVVVAVGAPSAWYAAQPAGPDDRAPAAPAEELRVVFFGLFTPLQGAPVIGEALAMLAGEPVHTTMVGTGQDLPAARQAASGNDQVRWLDWVPAAELPALVAAHDVCLGIFGDGPKAARVVPNKVFQGAAAGCAIVTSDSVSQQEALGDAARFVEAGDPQALADALRWLIADRERVWTLRQAAYRRAVEAFAPAAVVEPLHTRLQAGVRKRR